MALEEAGVRLVAQGAPQYANDLKGATQATDSFVKTTEEGGGIVSKAGGMMGSAIKNVAAIAAGVGVAGFLALGKAVIDGVGSAKEAAALLAQTNAVIESTGSAAGRSAEQITDLATALSASKGKSLFGDSDVQAAENLLLTFTNIKGAVFDAATTISVDMAQALGGAPKDQAIALGKALNDPIKGITALTRVGVTFSDQQKEQIKTMQEAGDVAGAQTIILDELNKEFGGSAEAAAKADGGWAQFKDTMGELEESIGAAILPLLNQLVGFLNASVVPIVSAAVDAFGGFVEQIMLADDPVGVLVDAVDQFSPVLGTVVGAIGDFITSGGDFGVVVDDLGEGFQGISPLLDTVIDGMRELIVWYNKGGASSIDLSSQLEDLNGVWNMVLKVVQDVASGYQDIIMAVLPVVQQFIAAHGTEIQAFFKTTWDSIIQIITLALQLYDSIVPPILHAIAAFINEHGSEIQKILSGVWTAISAIITGALETIKGVLKLALDLIHGNWQAAWEDIKHILDVQWEAIKGIITGLLNAIAGLFDTTLSDIASTWEHNWNSLVDIVSNIDWAQVGRDAVDGIINGLADAWDSLLGWVSDKAAGIAQAALDAIGAGSPAKEFMPVGDFAVQGIMAGFQSMWPALLNLVSDLGGDLVDEAQRIADQVQDAIADAFGATASIDRQKIANLKAVAELAPDLQGGVQEQLNQVEREAQGITDPKQAAAWFKMRSQQMIELANIQSKLNKDITAGERLRLEGQLKLWQDGTDQINAMQKAGTISEEDADAQRAQNAIRIAEIQLKLQGDITDQQRAQLIAQEQLINAAANADISQYKAQAQGGGGIGDLAAQIQKLLNNGNMPGLLDNPLLAQLAGLVGKLTAPPAAVPAAYGNTTHYSNTTTNNMPIYTNNTPAAMQQSWQVLQAGMI